MPEAIWIDSAAALAALARALEARTAIGIDTEFLRERTFFPKLCLVQIAAGGEIWCVDAIAIEDLEPLAGALTADATRKIAHAARQDLEALYLVTRRVAAPVFDTQVAAGCAGLRPQMGYAELVHNLLGVTLPKGETRTDWSKRPLTAAQLTYAAEDVHYLEEITALLETRLRELGRLHWVLEDCRALSDPRGFEPDPARAGERLKGIAQLPPRPRALAQRIATWRERLARERNLPRAWILPDAAIFAVAYAAPATRAALAAVRGMPERFSEGFASSLLETLNEPRQETAEDAAAALPGRPTPEQKACMDRLAALVDDRARELGVSPEILAPRGELKALALGRRHSGALEGWRREMIGERLLAALD